MQTAKFFIAKSDYQVSSANRATVRWVQFHNDAPYNSGGGINTVERATDFLDAMDSFSGQLVSTIGSNMVNELRAQYAHRHQGSNANDDSGTGPAVTIAGIAGFGGPWAATGQGNAGFDFKQNLTQIVDTVTVLRGKHSYKFGVDYRRLAPESSSGSYRRQWNPNSIAALTQNIAGSQSYLTLDLTALNARSAFFPGQRFYAQVLDINFTSGAAALSNLMSWEIF